MAVLVNISFAIPWLLRSWSMCAAAFLSVATAFSILNAANPYPSKSTVPTEKLSSNSTTSSMNYSLRNPTPRDAKELLGLVRESGALDENSCYAYLLLCDHFRETCLVAELEDQIAGFVAAYRPPIRPDSVFVWQVGVASSSRKQGLAKTMLRSLLALPACEDVNYLEATVTPSNIPSQRLFKSLADEVHAPLEIVTGFESAHFDTPSHEEESLFRIGPIEADRKPHNS